MKVPQRTGEITRDFLSQALEEAVDDFVLAEVAGTGSASTTIRVVARCGQEEHRLVVKMLPNGSENAVAFRNEVRFYAQVAPFLAIPVPRCRLSRIDVEHARAVLVLDESPGFHPRNGLRGAQIDTLARQLAILHAQTRTLKSWPRAGWSAADGEWLADEVESWARPAAWPHDGDALLDTVLGYLPRAYESLSSPLAVTHFDLHADNVLVAPDGGLCFLDWQDAVRAHPALDVGIAAGLLAPDADHIQFSERYLFYQGGGLRDFHERLREAVSIAFVLKLSWANWFHPEDPDANPYSEWGRGVAAARRVLFQK